MKIQESKRQIKFTLEVTHTIVKESCDPANPLQFKLNLNPDDKSISVGESYSTKKDLIYVFERIVELLNIIDNRSNAYSEAVTINHEVLRKYGYTEAAINGAYDTNVKKPFEKIDRIVYSHNSPGEAAVSYGSNYNGDKKPSGSPRDDL